MVDIELRDLNFYYQDKQVLSNINMSFNRSSISIIGPSNSGKSTLAKILANELPSNNIYINNNVNTNENDLYKNIGVVNNHLSFSCETVKNELAFGLENLKYNKDVMINKINYIVSYFNINNLLINNPYHLSYPKQLLIKILSYLIRDINYLVFDDIFDYLDRNDQILLNNYLKENNTRLINITTNINNILNSDYTYVLYNGKIIMEGNTIAIFKEEKLLKRIGLYLPTIVDISLQLKCYNLINKIYLDEKELVDDIWQ